jgi:citronellol/citronellal dehydrogenase
MADAAHWILTQEGKEVSGNFFIDEEVLSGAGVTDMEQYAVEPGHDLMPDFFI